LSVIDDEDVFLLAQVIASEAAEPFVAPAGSGYTKRSWAPPEEEKVKP
jgi:hypothetical protein